MRLRTRKCRACTARICALSSSSPPHPAPAPFALASCLSHILAHFAHKFRIFDVPAACFPLLIYVAVDTYPDAEGEWSLASCGPVRYLDVECRKHATRM